MAVAAAGWFGVDDWAVSGGSGGLWAAAVLTFQTERQGVGV